MPRAPQRTQQVQDAALPGVRLQAAPSPESRGAGFGQLASRVGLALYEQEIRAADHAAVMEAETIAGDSELTILSNMQTLQGKDAVTARELVDTQFKTVEDELTKGLSNDRQRGMLQSILRSRRQSLNRAALAHATSETEKYEALTYGNNVSQAVNLARAHAGDPLRLASEKDLIAQKVEIVAQRRGWDQDAHDGELTNIYSKMNTAAIVGMLERGNDLDAKRFYAELQGTEQKRTRVDASGQTLTLPARMQFTAQDRETVEKSLFEGSTRGEAHRQTLKILGEIGMDTPEQRRQALNMADAMGDDKVGELVRQKLEHRFAQEDKRKQEGYQQTFGNATKLIDEQWKQVPTASAREMVPAHVWADLSVQDRHTLNTYVGQLRDPGKKVTDIPTWAMLNEMKDDALAKVPSSKMLDYLTKLDKSNGDTLLIRWNGAINAKDRKQKDLKYEEFLTNKQLLDNAMELTGYFDLTIPRSKWPLEHQQLENRVQKLVDQALSQIPKDAPREKKEQAIQAVVDAQVKAKVKVDKGLFSFEQERAVGEFDDFKDAASIRVPLKEIPVGELDLIKGLLRRAEKKLDNGKIERIYALKRLRQAGKIDRQALIDRTQQIIEE
ncbi:MAG: hypothetical protein ACYCZR_00920 [Burkholderiales bacterium]